MVLVGAALAEQVVEPMANPAQLSAAVVAAEAVLKAREVLEDPVITSVPVVLLMLAEKAPPPTALMKQEAAPAATTAVEAVESPTTAAKAEAEAAGLDLQILLSFLILR